MTPSTRRAAKLGLESLETREVPALANVTNSATMILLQADNNGSLVTISRPTVQDKVTITDHHTGQTWKFSAGALDSKRLVFVGGSGSDNIYATNAIIPVTMDGKGGNDSLSGGTRADFLYGGSGNDNLYGGKRNDTMYGGSGRDKLYGFDGSDFLDDGGGTYDFTDGGAGDDFLARKPVRFGTLCTDVNQTQTPTCWVLAPLSAAASEGINLASRITYMGGGEYRVKLLNDDGGYCYQYVSLEGGLLNFEPDPQGDESWVIIFHRAIMQELDIDWKDKNDYRGGQCWEVMPMLTGREAEEHTAYGWEFTVSFLHDMRNALLQNKLVCAGTRQGQFDEGHILGDVNTPKLVGSHCYHVLNVNFETGQVTLRNPWGKDVNTSKGGVPTGDNSDGIVKITLEQFMDNFDTVGIS